MYKLDLEKVREQEAELPTSLESVHSYSRVMRKKENVFPKVAILALPKCLSPL